MQWKAQPTTTKKNSKDTPNPTRDHNTDQMRRVPFDSKGERGLPTSHLTILLMKTKVTTPYKYCENKTPVYNEEKKKNYRDQKNKKLKVERSIKVVTTIKKLKLPLHKIKKQVMIPEFVAVPCFWHLQTLDLVTTSTCHTLQWRQQQPTTVPPTLCYRVFCKTRNTGILRTVTVLTSLHTHTWDMPEQRTRDTQDRGQRNRWFPHRLWVSPFYQCGRTVENVNVANIACPGRARVNFLSCEKTELGLQNIPF